MTIAAALVIAPVILNASNPGETAFNFLKIGTGPRAVGMGEAFTSVADDSSAVYWNPAGLTQLDRYEFSLAHYSWLEGITFQNTNFAMPKTKWGSFGMGIYRLGKTDIQGYDSGGSATKKYEFSDTAAALSFAYPLKRFNSSAGITAKYISEKIAGESTSSFSFDLGLLGKFDLPHLSPLSAGLAVKNLGLKSKYKSDSYSMPLTVSAGVSSRFLHDSLLVSADYSLPSDNDAYLSFGSEFNAFPYTAFRAGYRTQFKDDGDLADGIRCGIGIGSDGIFIDYAYAPFGDLGDTHRFGISAKFGDIYETDQYRRRVDRHFRKAQNLYRTQNIFAAREQLKTVLALDPSHAEAAALNEKIVKELASVNIQIYVARAKKLIDRNKLIDAKTLCGKILEIRPDEPDAKALIDIIGKKLELEKGRRVEILSQQGEEFFTDQAYSDAVEIWEKVLLIAPDNPDISKRIEEARHEQKQLEINKNRMYADFLFKKAEKACSKKRWERADKLLREIMTVDPNHPKAGELIKSTKRELSAKQKALSEKLLKEGITLFDNKNIEQAHMFFKDALETFPDNEQAREYYSKTKSMIASANSENAMRENKKGLAAYSQRDLKSAVKYFKKALKLNPEYEEARKNLERAKKELNP